MDSLTSPHNFLPHHQFQGQTNDCAPYTLAMVINTLTSQHLDGAQLARAMDRPRWRTWGRVPYPILRRIPHNATFPWGLTDELHQHHLRAHWQFGAQIVDLITTLQTGRIALPIIGGLILHRWPFLWAHVKILVAYHVERGWGFVDPAHPRAEITWDSPTTFARYWGNTGHLLITVHP